MDSHLNDLLEQAYDHFNINPNLAIPDGKKLIREAERMKDYEALAYGHFVVGTSMFASGKRGDMLKHALHAVAYYKTTDNYRALAKSQNLLGNAYIAEEEFQFSLMAYLDARKSVKEGHIRGLGNSVDNNIATAYAELGDLGKAISILKKLFKKLKTAKKKEWDLFNVVCFNLADYYARLDDAKEAQFYLNEYENSWERGTNQLEHIIYTTLCCRIAYTSGDREKGNCLSDEIVECLKRKEENFELLYCFEMIALHQIKIGEYDRADRLADYLWKYSKKTGLPIDIIRACRVQAQYYYTIGEYDQAVKFYKAMDEQSIIREKESRKAQLGILEKTENLNRSLEQLQRDVEKQKYLNDRDSPTKLLNRSSMSNVLERYMLRAKEKGAGIGCIFIDVDFFKEYNDTYGHVKGDECLKKISEVCLEAEKHREHIHFARYGGDEFFGMLSGYTDEQVQEIAKEIACGVRKLGIIHGHQRVRGQVTVSIGVMNLASDDISSILDLVTFSDKALYHSKGNGKDCIYMFDQKIFKETEEFEYNRIEYM